MVLWSIISSPEHLLLKENILASEVQNKQLVLSSFYLLPPFLDFSISNIYFYASDMYGKIFYAPDMYEKCIRMIHFRLFRQRFISLDIFKVLFPSRMVYTSLQSTITNILLSLFLLSLPHLLGMQFYFWSCVYWWASLFVTIHIPYCKQILEWCMPLPLVYNNHS